MLGLYFPVIYDMKYLMKFCDSLHGGLQKLAEARAAHPAFLTRRNPSLPPAAILTRLLPSAAGAGG